MPINAEAKSRAVHLKSPLGRDALTQQVAAYKLLLDVPFQPLESNISQGLIHSEAAQRLTRYCPLSHAQTHQRSTSDIFLAQFRSVISALLIATIVIALTIGEKIEAIAIVIVIVLNASSGLVTAWKPEPELSALWEQTVQVAHVIRKGLVSKISAAGLVLGDLVVLPAGARASAVEPVGTVICNDAAWTFPHPCQILLGEQFHVE